MPSIRERSCCASRSPEVLPGGRSICVTSPVTTAFEPNPMRVRNIFICSDVVFCASSRMMNASFKRAAAHEGDRRHLDDAALEQLRGLLVAEDVVQRVVERPQIRVDLLDEVARQEAEPLPRLDRRAGEDDPLDLLLEERRRRHRHGEIGLARAGGPDREDEVVAVDRLDVDAAA